jgi:transcriptional regulator with XRE-family HTH domain
MLDSLKRTLGLKVKMARKRLGLTQDDLAAKVDRTPESISNIERGQHLPTIETLAKIAAALEVPLPEFLESVSHSDSAPTARAALETRLRSAAERLDDLDLQIAVGQIELLASRR